LAFSSVACFPDSVVCQCKNCEPGFWPLLPTTIVLLTGPFTGPTKGLLLGPRLLRYFRESVLVAVVSQTDQFLSWFCVPPAEFTWIGMPQVSPPSVERLTITAGLV